MADIHDYGKIYCQDAEVLMKILPKFKCQIHDIPYNISVKNSDIKFANRKDMYRDFGDWDEQMIDLPDFARDCHKCAEKDANVLVFFNNWFYYSQLVTEFSKYFEGVDSLVWQKTNPRPQVRKRNFTMSHELLLWAHRGNYSFNFTDHADMMSVVKCGLALGNDRLKDKDGNVAHKTQKPVKLIQYFVEKLSEPGDVILDAYAGVFTTAVAAIRSGRKFLVNEINENYVNYGIEWIKKELNTKRSC